MKKIPSASKHIRKIFVPLISFLGIFFFVFSSQDTKPVKTELIEKVQVRLLLVDAIIEDRYGDQLRGLTKDDFQLFIDGVEKQISIFEEHCASSNRERMEVIAARTVSVADAEPRHIIFCFGPSRPAWGGPFEAVKAAREFVKENMRSSDRIMVVSFVNDLRILQDFTSDKRKLLAAINKIKELTPLHLETLPAGSGSGRFGYAFEDDDLNNRMAISNFRSLFAILAPIREKKALVYFCAQLYLSPELSRMINEANSARVSIYTVDMVGLTGPHERRGEAFIFNAFSSLSIDTGGKVLKWSNDLTRYIPVIEKDLSCYYLVGCYLDKEADGKQHSLSLIAKDLGLKVRSRTGFVYSK